METTTLFPGMDLSEVAQDRGSTIPEAPQPPRVRRPDRDQALMQPCRLEDILPADHQARAIWAAVETLDLSKFYEPFKARGSEPGRVGHRPEAAHRPAAVRHGRGHRQRMGRNDAKPIDSRRASTAETVNADLRTFRGLSNFAVRGLKKVKCQALWSALAYNLMHFATVLIT